MKEQFHLPKLGQRWPSAEPRDLHTKVKANHHPVAATTVGGGGFLFLYVGSCAGGWKDALGTLNEN